MISRSPEKASDAKQQEKFYSRLLSEQNSAANPSFRVYYGMASGSVPFLWESQPGTPKRATSSTTIPPLTPPPSYYYNSNAKRSKKPSKSTFINFIFPKLTLRKARPPSPSPSPSPSPPPSMSSSSVSSSSSTE